MSSTSQKRLSCSKYGPLIKYVSESLPFSRVFLLNHVEFLLLLISKFEWHFVKVKNFENVHQEIWKAVFIKCHEVCITIPIRSNVKFQIFAIFGSMPTTTFFCHRDGPKIQWLKHEKFFKKFLLLSGLKNYFFGRATHSVSQPTSGGSVRETLAAAMINARRCAKRACARDFLVSAREQRADVPVDWLAPHITALWARNFLASRFYQAECARGPAAAG
jgi:hypothetical protein